MPHAEERDRNQRWGIATCSSSAFFVCGVVVLAIATQIIGPDGADIPSSAYLLTTGVHGAIAAVSLLWKSTAVGRAIAVGAITAFALWSTAAFVVALLYQLST
ncbi:hypothetical protein AB0C34_30080 [Nocardia sp. NPDC049220]|uniref:hypothetical protein n=1 Tax=Nocardia sp. NPDC049220 TaxID=3155273 RepID=UPI0033F2CE66